MISDNIEYEINTQPLPSRKVFSLLIMTATKGGSHLKKVSENETRTHYVLLTAKS